MTVKLRKHESFNRMMRRFDRQDRRYGNVNDYRKHSFYVGPSKKRQLKSEKARQNKKRWARKRKNRIHRAKMRRAYRF